MVALHGMKYCLVCWVYCRINWADGCMEKQGALWPSIYCVWHRCHTQLMHLMQGALSGDLPFSHGAHFPYHLQLSGTILKVLFICLSFIVFFFFHFVYHSDDWYSKLSSTEVNFVVEIILCIFFLNCWSVYNILMDWRFFIGLMVNLYILIKFRSTICRAIISNKLKNDILKCYT